jgi:hypothetical protein
VARISVVHLSARRGASEMQLSLRVEEEVWDENRKMVVCNYKFVHATVIHLLVLDVYFFRNRIKFVLYQLTTTYTISVIQL